MNVQVAAKALLYEKVAEKGLTGDVFCMTGGKGTVFVSRITVPIVDYGSDYTRYANELADAEPGKYFLQLFLPSGRVITKNFEILPDKTTQVIIELPHEGPHEWTTLHALTGQFKQDIFQTKKLAASLPITTASYAELTVNPCEGYSLGLLQPEKTPAGDVFDNLLTLPNLARLIKKNIDVGAAMQHIGTPSDIVKPSFEDDQFAVFRIAHEGLLDHGNKAPHVSGFGRDSDLQRQYLVQKSSSGGTLICLPTPWTTPFGQAEVELLFKKNSVASMPDVAMTIGDPMINSVLGYINTGAIQKAAELVDFNNARDMLFDKVSYPFTATVGGYLLVFGINRKAYLSESDNWKAWVKNLDKWFRWLPDGALLHAALYFVLKGVDRDEAYEALMRGCDRGLPFFTFGLKLMVDALRFFARDGDAKARHRLPLIEAIANQTDPSQPFLTVSFSNHWKTEVLQTKKVTPNA